MSESVNQLFHERLNERDEGDLLRMIQEIEARQALGITEGELLLTVTCPKCKTPLTTGAPIISPRSILPPNNRWFCNLECKDYTARPTMLTEFYA